jgi:DNA-directed RNA polymerase subunit F
MINMSEERFLNFADVRDQLIDAQERRGFLTYEQKMAQQHAEWAASEARNGFKTDSKVFKDMFEALMKIGKIAKFPDIAAKLAELMPMDSVDVRAVLGSRRITIESSEIEEILDIIRQHVGVE